MDADDFDEAREALMRRIGNSENEDIYCENYMREIIERGEAGDKRQVTYLLAEGLESTRPKLRLTVLNVLANSSERLGVFLDSTRYFLTI